MIDGAVVNGINDGSFVLEIPSAKNPGEWVRKEPFPRASLEVTLFSMHLFQS